MRHVGTARAKRSPLSTLRIRSEPRELLHHPLVDLALERHDEARQVLYRLPSPSRELRLVAAAGMRDIDLDLISGEAESVPLLPMTPILSLPGLRQYYGL